MKRISVSAMKAEKEVVIMSEEAQHSQLTLARWISDSAVLQRDQPIVLRGTALLGVEVRAGFDNEEMHVGRANEQGKWSMTVPAHAAGGPHTLTVESGDEQQTVSDILFGDVLILGGQSNMQLWMGRLVSRYPLELSHAHDTAVRFFPIHEDENFDGPIDSLRSGNWLVEGRDDISQESGVGYFTAKRLRAEHPDVPIGLIETAIGGTPIEPWIDEARLRRLGRDMSLLDAWKQTGYPQARMTAYHHAFDEWINTLQRLDAGVLGQWSAPDFNDSDWQSVSLAEAGTDSDLFNQPGTVWMRRSVRIPQEFVGSPMLLRLGTIIDADDCWVNGSLIGQTAYRYPPRDYQIASAPQTLQITLRIRVDGVVNGGLTAGKQHALCIQTDTDRQKGTWSQLIDLNEGEWKVRRGARIWPAPAQPFASRVPAGCFNAMIAPLTSLGCAAIVWYQGESSATRGPEGYGNTMIALIQSWREVFNNPHLPFVEVQLPNIGFEARGWARLRNEQRAVLALDNTAMAVTLGLGENNDLHPTNKDGVAARVVWALDSLVYHALHSPSGPQVAHVSQTQGRIRILWTNCDQGLKALAPLSVQILVPGQPVLTLPAHIVSSDEVDVPLSDDTVLPPGTLVRFQWGDAPAPLLENGCDQVATPFEERLEGELQ
jgi:sialate O-acetylesterase